MSLEFAFNGFELSSEFEDPEPCENACSETSADLAILSVADLQRCAGPVPKADTKGLLNPTPDAARVYVHLLEHLVQDSLNNIQHRAK